MVCTKKTKTLLAIACLSLLPVIGCDSNSSTATPSGSSATSSSQAAGSDAVNTSQAAKEKSATCEDIFGGLPGDKPGSRGDLPADFPEPPTGSTLCGSDRFGSTTYVNTAMSDDKVLKHYHAALQAQGYEVDDIGSGLGAGDQGFTFRRPGVVNGSVYTNGDKDPFQIKYKDSFKIGYNLLKK